MFIKGIESLWNKFKVYTKFCNLLNYAELAHRRSWWAFSLFPSIKYSVFKNTQASSQLQTAHTICQFSFGLHRSWYSV